MYMCVCVCLSESTYVVGEELCSLICVAKRPPPFPAIKALCNHTFFFSFLNFAETYRPEVSVTLFVFVYVCVCNAKPVLKSLRIPHPSTLTAASNFCFQTFLT